jgi:hypothetical protein
MSSINIIQVPLNSFAITVMWQFLTLAGLDTTQNLIPRTFKQEEIQAADPVFQQSMAAMTQGLNEKEVYQVFGTMKTKLAHDFLDAAWARATLENKQEYDALYNVLKQHDMYLPTGIAYSDAHKELMRSLTPFIALYRSQNPRR